MKIGMFIVIPGRDYVNKTTTTTVTDAIMYQVGAVVPVVKQDTVIGYGQIVSFEIINGSTPTTKITFKFSKVGDAEAKVLQDFYNRNRVSGAAMSDDGDYDTNVHIPGRFTTKKQSWNDRKKQIWDDDDYDDDDDRPVFGHHHFDD